MRRRDFIAGIAGLAAAWPCAAHAQQSAIPVIGYLGGGFTTTSASFVAPFRLGLSEIGWVEGRNVAIEFRWAEDQYADQLPGLAADLVSRQDQCDGITEEMTASVTRVAVNEEPNNPGAVGQVAAIKSAAQALGWK